MSGMLCDGCVRRISEMVLPISHPILSYNILRHVVSCHPILSYASELHYLHSSKLEEETWHAKWSTVYDCIRNVHRKGRYCTTTQYNSLSIHINPRGRIRKPLLRTCYNIIQYNTCNAIQCNTLRYNAMQKMCGRWHRRQEYSLYS